MSRTRTWGAATAGVCVLVLVAAWLLLIAPKRAEATELRGQAVALDEANAQSRVKIQRLKAQYDDLPVQRAELAVVRQQLPAAPALPQLIRKLSAMADAAGVKLVTVTPSAPVPFTGAAPVTGSVTLPSAGASSAQLLGIATTVTVTGDYASSTLFLQKLQAADPSRGSQMNRAFLVQEVKLAPQTDAASVAPGPSAKKKGQVTMTVTGQVFVLAPAGAAAGATTSGSTAPSTAPAPTPIPTTGSAS